MPLIRAFASSFALAFGALALATGFLSAGTVASSSDTGSGAHRTVTAALTIPAGSIGVTWAPATTAGIHPGIQLITGGAQCTSNFIYSDGTAVFVGMAAHCAGTGGNTATNGCSSPSLPVGTPVQIQGASQPGTLVYSSWLTMQTDHESDPTVCQYNDLALVQVDTADIGNVNPSVPTWGGPSGLDASGTKSGEQLYAYGDSELYAGLPVGAMEGFSLGDTGNGWSTSVDTVLPGVPGDSGSGFLDSHGNALGVLSTLDAGIPGGVFNGVGNLDLELQFLHSHSSFGAVQLVEGTVPFNPNQLPLGL